MANKWTHTRRDVAAAMKWADNNPSKDPHNGGTWSSHCLAASRQMYGLPVLASSAAILANKADDKWGRFIHRAKGNDWKNPRWWDDLPRGAFILSNYGTYGHAWVASKTTSFSTDYTTRGKLLHAPRNLPRWGSITAKTVGWLCGFEVNGVDTYIKGIECPYPKHEGKH
jgi:hypothetical protein